MNFSKAIVSSFPKSGRKEVYTSKDSSYTPGPGNYKYDQIKPRNSKNYMK